MATAANALGAIRHADTISLHSLLFLEVPFPYYFWISTVFNSQRHGMQSKSPVQQWGASLAPTHSHILSNSPTDCLPTVTLGLTSSINYTLGWSQQHLFLPYHVLGNERVTLWGREIRGLPRMNCVDFWELWMILLWRPLQKWSLLWRESSHSAFSLKNFPLRLEFFIQLIVRCKLAGNN